MFGLDNKSGINVMPPIAPADSQTPLWFTEGGAGLSATYPGQDWFNQIQAELLNVLKAADIAPQKGNLSQLSSAISKLASAYAVLIVHTTGDSLTSVMSQKSVTDLTNKKFNISDIVSEIGYSNDKVMDQRIVTNELAKRLLISDVVNEAGLSTEKVMNQRAVTEELSQRPTKNDVNNAIAAINDELAKKGNKNTALKSSKGWFKDESTGMIMQWGDWSVGEGGGGEVTVDFAIPFPFSGVVSAISVNDAAAQMVGYSGISKTGMKIIKGSNDDRGRSGQYIVWGW
ncbi:hypothetical protein [Morganella morganii]|uniref:gp53-like domain-containing protein n=1 Tax=Morganella morganii TaxID=582 RepID=UPI001AD858CD|nr:hypothetical protein [Morganella morganii]ELO7537279.1 hypothetical protein [Morganella morganii]MBO8064117.1 hypothetical protein [Morganella morganii]